MTCVSALLQNGHFIVGAQGMDDRDRERRHPSSWRIQRRCDTSTSPWLDSTRSHPAPVRGPD
jgi:hypothetical protein